MMRIMVVLAAIMVLTGCTPLQRDAVTEGGVLASEAALADRLLQKGDVADVVTDAKMPEEDFNQLVRAQDIYTDVREELAGYLNDPVMLTSVLDELQIAHMQLRGAARSVKEVVVNNWEDYTPAQRRRLQQWWQLAEDIEKQYRVFIVAAHKAESEQMRNEAAMETLLVLAKLAAAGV